MEVAATVTGFSAIRVSIPPSAGTPTIDQVKELFEFNLRELRLDAGVDIPVSWDISHREGVGYIGTSFLILLQCSPKAGAEIYADFSEALARWVSGATTEHYSLTLPGTEYSSDSRGRPEGATVTMLTSDPVSLEERAQAKRRQMQEAQEAQDKAKSQRRELLKEFVALAKKYGRPPSTLTNGTRFWSITWSSKCAFDGDKNGVGVTYSGQLIEFMYHEPSRRFEFRGRAHGVDPAELERAAADLLR